MSNGFGVLHEAQPGLHDALAAVFHRGTGSEIRDERLTLVGLGAAAVLVHPCQHAEVAAGLAGVERLFEYGEDLALQRRTALHLPKELVLEPR